MGFGRLVAIAVGAVAVWAAPAAQASYVVTGPATPVGNSLMLELTNVVAADSNKDGRLDLAIGNQGTNQILLFPNTGTGFGSPATRGLPAAANQDFTDLAGVEYSFAYGKGFAVGTQSNIFGVRSLSGALLPGPTIAAPFGQSTALASDGSREVFRAIPGRLDSWYGSEEGSGDTLVTGGPGLTLPIGHPVDVAFTRAFLGYDVAVVDNQSADTKSGGLFVLYHDRTKPTKRFNIAGKPSAGATWTRSLNKSPDLAVSTRFAEGDGAVELFERTFGAQQVERRETLLLPAAPSDVEVADLAGDFKTGLVVQAQGTYVYQDTGGELVPIAGSPFRTPGDTSPFTKVSAADIRGDKKLELIVSAPEAGGTSTGGFSVLAIPPAEPTPARLPCNLIAVAKKGAKVTDAGKQIALAGGSGTVKTGAIPCSSTVTPGKGEVVLIQNPDSNSAGTNRAERKRITIKGATVKLKAVTSRGKRYIQVKLAGKKRCRTSAKLSITGAGRFMVGGKKAWWLFGSKRASGRITDSCRGGTTVKVSRGSATIRSNGKNRTLGKGRQIRVG